MEASPGPTAARPVTTSVVAVDELLAALASGLVAVAVAVLTTTRVSKSKVAWIAMLALAETPRSPTEQLIRPPLSEQVPWDGTADA